MPSVMHSTFDVIRTATFFDPQSSIIKYALVSKELKPKEVNYNTQLYVKCVN